jgi:hypothetical protein
MKRILLYTFLGILTLGKTSAQEGTGLPKIIENKGHHTLIVDGKPYFILGGQAHNSSAWPAMMPDLNTAVESMHLNTLEVPIYWEQVESSPGKFDFSILDTLLYQARKHQIHLVILWFGTWKNGSNHYMPEWMKRDSKKYPNITSNKGQPIDSPSPIIEATMEKDTKAFTSFLHYLKEADSQHTVIMVQVENEPGAWGSIRDYSPLAQKIFDEKVPKALMEPKVLESLNVPVVKTGNWQEVFGNRADEYFQAWFVSRYIGKVAEAGKKEYPLPLYVNAALREPFGNPMANTYESGGPTDNVIPIWKVAAPSIDLLAPDIYLKGSDKILKVIDLYDRPDNPLFVPEFALQPINSKYLYSTLARGGIGFSPFGIDDNQINPLPKETKDRLEAFADEYQVLSPFIHELAQWGSEGKIKAVVEHEDHNKQTVDLGSWQALVSFGNEKHGGVLEANTDANGGVLIIKLDENQFMVVGKLAHLTFQPLGNQTGKAWQYLKVEEGSFENGEFKPKRILNGDETDWGGPSLWEHTTILRISLIVR